MIRERVLVLGNAGLDITLRLPRLPNKGETLLGEGTGSAPGGKGLNQAVAAARAGAQVIFHAPIGQDAQGNEIAAALAIEEFTLLDVRRMPYPSDYSLLMVLPDGENSIASAGSCAAALTEADAKAFAANARPGDVFVLQGNLTRAATKAALIEAQKQGATTLLNPAPLWWDVEPLMPFCGIVVVNRGEAETITGLPDPEDAAKALCNLGASLVIITLGAEGCFTFDRKGTGHYYSAPQVDAIDTTGCGDTFCGVFAAMLAKGKDCAEAIDLAQGAASLTAQRMGAFTALPRREEFMALLAQNEGR